MQYPLSPKVRVIVALCSVAFFAIVLILNYILKFFPQESNRSLSICIGFFGFLFLVALKDYKRTKA